MKHKRQIQVLTNLGGTTDFPTYNSPFLKWESMLREVIAENFDYPTHKTLEYDESNQVFYFTLKVGGLMTHQLRDKWPSRDRIGMDLTFMVEINPRFDVMQQLQAAQEQHEHMRERQALLQALLYKHEYESESNDKS